MGLRERESATSPVKSMFRREQASSLPMAWWCSKKENGLYSASYFINLYNAKFYVDSLPESDTFLLLTLNTLGTSEWDRYQIPPGTGSIYQYIRFSHNFIIRGNL